LSVQNKIDKYQERLAYLQQLQENVLDREKLRKTILYGLPTNKVES